MPLPVVASWAWNVAPAVWAAVLIDWITSPTVVVAGDAHADLHGRWRLPGSVCEIVKSVPPGVCRVDADALAVVQLRQLRGGGEACECRVAWPSCRRFRRWRNCCR